MPGFLDLFKKSPFGPLVEHLNMVKLCMDDLKPLFLASIDKNYEKVDYYVKEISKYEHKADIIKTEIRNNLPKGIFLPVHREELQDYLKLQDAIADTVEDISLLLAMKKLHVPDDLKEDLLKFIDKIIEVWEASYTVTKELSLLVEVAFSGHEANVVLEKIEIVERLEWECDCVGMKLAKHLFELENKISPVDIMLWFKIFDVMGKLANNCEKTAVMLRRFLN